MEMDWRARGLFLFYNVYMKLLIADTIFPRGHHCLNKHLLKILLQNDEITDIKVLNYHDYYVRCSNKMRSYDIAFLFKNKSAYIDYICQFLNSLLLMFRCIGIQYDKVLFFTFDTLSLSFLRLGFFKPIYLFHHNNTDHLLNKYKLKVFKTYMNKVNHIVFADFIKDYLISLGVDSNRIFVVSHPLPTSALVSKEIDIVSEDSVYIALGHANDERIIDNLIEYEKQEHRLEKNNIHLVLRSQKEYDKLPPSIDIVTDFLDEEQYRYYYKVAKGILILYPDCFKYRFSGALLDAFVARKKIIGRNIPIIQHYARKYSSCCIFLMKLRI